MVSDNTPSIWGRPRVRQGDISESVGGRSVPCEGDIPRGPLLGDCRRGEGETGSFWSGHTDDQVVDFWHATEYLGKAATVLYRGQLQRGEAWMDESCHKLKHEPGGAAAILKRLKYLSKVRPWAKEDEDVQRAITYFTNQTKAGRMDYAARVIRKEPIGSGCDGSGLQGDRQATALRVGHEMERGWSRRGDQSTVLNPHGGAMGSILGKDRQNGDSLWPLNTSVPSILHQHHSSGHTHHY